MPGLFDEKLMAFRRNSILSTDAQVIETLPMGPGGQPMKTTIDFASAQTTTTATESAAGGVDGVIAYSLEGMYELISYPSLAEGMAPFDLDATIGSVTTDMTYTGGRPESFLALLSWFVAHPSTAAITAGRVSSTNAPS